MKIITNNQVRDIIYGYQLTEDERKEFDYIDWKAVEGGSDVAEFVRYKGELYDLRDLETCTIEGWDGMVTETCFSGVLFRFHEDIDVVIVGRYYT